MIIRGMSFMNYKKFKEATELSLEQFTGRIGILGNNGSGKSSLLDVILIALYGVEAVTGKKEHLRTQGLDKDLVKLRLDFEHCGKHFIIEREFRGANLTPKASLFEVVSEIPQLLATSAKEANSYVEKILNMDYSTFVATVFCKQKELNKLSAMLPTERKAFILKLSKVDDIDDEIKKTRELRRESEKYVSMLMEEVTAKEIVLKQIEQLDKDIKTMKTEHKGALNKLSSYEKKLKDAELIKKDLDDKYESYNELTLELKDCKNNIDNIDKEISRLTNEQKELTSLELYLEKDGYPLLEKQKSLQSNLDNMDSIRPKYIEKKQLYSNLVKIKNDGTTAKSTAESLYNEAKSLGFNKESIGFLEESILKVEKEIDELKNLKLKKEGEANSYKSKLDEWNKEIDNINNLYSQNSSDNGCKCPMCKQVVSKEYISIVEKHYTEQISKHTSTYEKILEEITKLNNSIKDSLNQLNSNKEELKKTRELEKTYNEIVANYNAAKKHYSEKVGEYTSLSEKYKEYANIEFNEQSYIDLKNNIKSLEDTLKKVYIAIEKVKNIPTINNDIDKCMTEKETAKEKYQDIVTRGKALNFNREEYLKAKQNYEKAYIKYNDVKEENSILLNQINAKDVTERKFLLDKIETINKKEKEYNKHKRLVNDFTIIEEGLKNTKDDIMSKINPLINKHFSEIFKTLLNEKYDDVELDENYNIAIFDCGESFPLSRFSGGEQDLCNLSLRLAVSKFLAEINSGSIEFIVLDEIFASLDDDKKSSLIEVLGGLNNFFKQIFIISHEDVIKSSLDYYITVKENEYRYSEIEY